MRDAMATIFWKATTLSWLTGPIFDKELRISSRRKRNYFLRVAYLLILLLVLALIWAEEIGLRSNSIGYQISRLSQVGLVITGVVVMIQFYLAQIISVVMLSNSISDEVYHKTLGVLMSTPISTLHVVAGKIFSKLLQITLLLCLTLPILGIVRVFGGVPWNFLLISFCITLMAVIFAGMLTLNFSIHDKHAYIAIIRTVLALLLLYLFLPLFLGWIVIEHFDVKENAVFKWVMVANPLLIMQVLVQELFSPRSIPFSTFGWGWHCLFMLTGSALLFLRAVIVVRKKALLQACGQLDRIKKKRGFFLFTKMDKIRRVKGPPLLWKELRSSTFNMGVVKKTLSVILIAGSILISYYIFEQENFLDEADCHIMYGMIFSISGLFFTATFAATTITSEKNSRTWPILLSTLVTDWQIIAAKVIGVFRRSAPFWSILFLHAIFFTSTYIHPAALPQIITIIVPLVFFATSSGVLFSCLFKHTTSAVIANLIFVALIWGGIPLLAVLIGEIMHLGDDLIEAVIMLNPFYHLGEILNSTGGSSHAGKLWSQLIYHWKIGGEMNFIKTMIMLTAVGSLHIAAGVVFLVITKIRLRKKIV